MVFMFCDDEEAVLEYVLLARHGYGENFSTLTLHPHVPPLAKRTYSFSWRTFINVVKILL